MVWNVVVSRAMKVRVDLERLVGQLASGLLLGEDDHAVVVFGHLEVDLDGVAFIDGERTVAGAELVDGDEALGLVLDVNEDFAAMAEFVSTAFESIVADWPQFLVKLSSALAPQAKSGMVGSRLVALAFARQVLRTGTPVVEASLKKDAIETLLMSARWEREAAEGGAEATQVEGETDEEEEAARNERRKMVWERKSNNFSIFTTDEKSRRESGSQAGRKR